MTIDIYNYAGKAKGVSFDVEHLEIAVMRIISGDEVLVLLYTNGVEQVFDSSDSRLLSFDDGFEIVFSRALGIDELTARAKLEGEE